MKLSNHGACFGMDRRIYFDNHQSCYYLDGINGAPHLMYTLSPSTTADKIVAVMLYHMHVRSRHPTPEEKENILVALTNDGYLKVMSADTGHVLRSIFLSTITKYRYLSWADYLHSIQVKSVHLQPQQNPCVLTHSQPILAIIIFKTHPIRLAASLVIDKQIFGKDVIDGSIEGGILMIIHSSKKYCFYNFEEIKKNYSVLSSDIGDQVEVNGNWGTIGQAGFGIPITIKLTELPPVIFQSRSSVNVGINFGGVPFVYIHNPRPQQPHQFHVKDLSTSRLIGEISSDYVSLQDDTVGFHDDDYQKILYISGPSLSCYQLVRDSLLGTVEMIKVWERNFAHSISSQQITYSSSGRRIKKASYANFDVEVIVQDTDYENELELLYAVVTQPGYNESVETQLHFIDDKTGSSTKIIPLPEWNENAANTVYYELDVIVHEVKTDNVSNCYLYRLSRPSVDET
ncbi:DDB1- and CUL4-associated factor 17-like isoform X2 [Dysidea avara]